MKYAEFFRLIEKKDHLIKKLGSLTDEQKQEAIDFFTEHPSYEKEINWNKKDLTWADFEAVMTKERVSRSQLKNFVKEGTHYLKLYSDDKLTIYQPLTWVGSRYLASKEVYPYVVGEWCISKQKDRDPWDDYSFGVETDYEDEDTYSNPCSFIFVCTPTTKWALEIEIYYPDYYKVWNSEDTEVSDIDFFESLREELPNIDESLIEECLSDAVDNHYLVENAHELDLETSETLRKLKISQRKSEIKSSIKKKGFYVWEGNLTKIELLEYELIDVTLSKIDNVVSKFKVTGNYSLSGTRVTNIVWPIEVKGGFIGCKSLKEIVIPDSIISISNHAFEGCSSLTSVTIPDSVTSIGQYAFWKCSSLTEITIPNSVTSIGKYAFSLCSSLKKIYIDREKDSISLGFDWKPEQTEVYWKGEF